jgi:cytochrome P450
VVTGYEDIRRVALDDATFSSAETILIPPKKNAAQKSIPIEMDAPEFLEYRRIMQPLFAPPAVERLAPVIEYYANHCIDEFIEHGETDIVHEFADPVPVMVTLHKLGMPIDDWRRYAEPMHKTVFLRQDNPARVGVLEQLGWIAETIKDAIKQRRQSPRDDMISYLLNSRPFGEPVSDHDAQEMIMLTMQGGFDTTGSAISSALLHLDRNRDDRQRLIDHPELMDSAVEEFLRVGAPQFALARTAKRDVELGGQQIAEGDRVLLVWASGNRDESVFERPDDVLLERDPNRHMAFGLGAHRCLGSTLARRQIKVALATILRRLPDYEVDHSRLVRAETIGVTYGTFAMPITFTPGRRILA